MRDRPDSSGLGSYEQTRPSGRKGYRPSAKGYGSWQREPTPENDGYPPEPPPEHSHEHPHEPPSPPRGATPYPPAEPTSGYPTPPPSEPPPYPTRPEPPAYSPPSTPPSGPSYGPVEETPGYDPAREEPKVPCEEEEPQECAKPSDQLAKLKGALDNQDVEIKSLTKQRDSLRDDITGLEQTVTDLSKVVAAYKEACKSLKDQKRELDTYVATKTPMLDAAVKDKKPRIEQCITGIDEWITHWKDYAKHLEWLAGQAVEEAEATAAVAGTKQTDYDALKDSAKQLDTLLKELKALRDAIEKEDDNNKTANMYFLLKQLKAELEKITIRTPRELEDDLCAAWTELSQAKAAARAAKAASEAAAEASAGAKKKYEEAVAKRRDTILQCISQLCADTPSPKEQAY